MLRYVKYLSKITTNVQFSTSWLLGLKDMVEKFTCYRNKCFRLYNLQNRYNLQVNLCLKKYYTVTY